MCLKGFGKIQTKIIKLFYDLINQNSKIINSSSDLFLLLVQALINLPNSNFNCLNSVQLKKVYFFKYNKKEFIN